MGASFGEGQRKRPGSIDQIKKGNPTDGLPQLPVEVSKLLLRRGGVSHRVAGFLDRAVDLASGFLGGTFLAAGEGEPEEQSGAHDAKGGIGMSHGLQATPRTAAICRAPNSPVGAR